MPHAPFPTQSKVAIMGRTYKATGINLKGMPLGESDRLLTILTREHGLVRAIAPGARKPHSRLGGRSGLFVVNELLIHKGRSLDKITQAETLESYPGLSRDFGKLAAGQYLAEVALCQALSEQPQEDLFCLLSEHLSRLEQLPAASNGQMPASLLAHLAHGIFHLLALAGVAPQVQGCCLTQRPIIPDFSHPDWRAGFSIAAGGIVSLSELARLAAAEKSPTPALGAIESDTAQAKPVSSSNRVFPPPARKPVSSSNRVSDRSTVRSHKPLKLDSKLSAVELSLLQQLAKPDLSGGDAALSPTSNRAIASAWLAVERILRQYAQHHFDRSIRSAALMDTYFASEANSPISHDPTV